MPDSPHPARLEQLAELARRLGHDFKDLTLLDRALCHASTGNDGRPSYERLEFLGDAILGFLVADSLFHRKPEIPEGELTDRRAHIVSRIPLAKVSDSLALANYLVGGRGLREQDLDSRRIRADLVEATLAAIYLDGGIRAARRFVVHHVLAALAEHTHGNAERDPKSRLLHWAQIHAKDQPTYQLLRAWGPHHERQFEVAVLLQGKPVAVGHGRTKQAAEKAAAEQALQSLSESDAATGTAAHSP